MNIVYGDRDFECKQSRKLMIEKKKLDCKIIRINPVAADFNIYRQINQIQKHIKQSNNNLSKRLLGLEFKSNHSIKSKCLQWIVKIYNIGHKSFTSSLFFLNSQSSISHFLVFQRSCAH